MTASQLSGKPLAKLIQQQAAAQAKALAEEGPGPTLAVVVATEDSSTHWYVRSIERAARNRRHRLPHHRRWPRRHRTGAHCGAEGPQRGAFSQRHHPADPPASRRQDPGTGQVHRPGKGHRRREPGEPGTAWPSVNAPSRRLQHVPLWKCWTTSNSGGGPQRGGGGPVNRGGQAIVPAAFAEGRHHYRLPLEVRAARRSTPRQPTS